MPHSLMLKVTVTLEASSGRSIAPSQLGKLANAGEPFRLAA